MIVFYFSGTGNSRFIAEQFSRAVGAGCRSVEEATDFDALIEQTDAVGFCYPVYGSCVPRPMREFVLAHGYALTKKRIVILCTQLAFSGDGAHALCAFLPGEKTDVVYAEHFNMPNNISNFLLFPVKNGMQNKTCLKKAIRRAERAADEVLRGVIRRRGFHWLSVLIGKCQSVLWPLVERQAANDVRISADCTRCGLCARICPMHNLKEVEDGIEQGGICALCYRCVNACPERAITTLLHQKPKKQYLGISEEIVSLSR